MSLTKVDTIFGPGLVENGDGAIEGVQPFPKKGQPPQLKLSLRNGGAFYVLHSRANAIALFGPAVAALIEPPKDEAPAKPKRKAKKAEVSDE